jgi:hypothetical protein
MNIAEILLALTLKDFHTNTQTFKTMITIYIFLDGYIFFRSTKEVFKMQGAWASPNTLPI